VTAAAGARLVADKRPARPHLMVARAALRRANIHAPLVRHSMRQNARTNVLSHGGLSWPMNA
jgi:hypothetical protein